MLIPRRHALPPPDATPRGRLRRPETWARAADVTTVFANGAVILALLIAYITYQAQRDAEASAAERALELAKFEYSVRTVSQLAEGRIGEARDYLYGELLRAGFDQLADLPDDAGLRARIIEAMAETAEEPQRLKLSVAAVVDYYDHVAACLKTNLCDEAVLREHVGDYARRFACFFDATIKEMREELGDPDYGVSLRHWLPAGGCGTTG